jgi:hypothetical protein
MIDPVYLLKGTQLSMGFWKEYPSYAKALGQPSVASYKDISAFLPFRVVVPRFLGVLASRLTKWAQDNASSPWYYSLETVFNTDHSGAQIPEYVQVYHFEEETDALAFRMKFDIVS